MSYQTPEQTPSARFGGGDNPSIPKKAAEITGDTNRDITQNYRDPDTTQKKKEPLLSSEGGIGKQFNPEGNIGQIGNKIGGPFSEDGMIGSQFDASKEGIAGKVERAVGGPRKDT
ncbi:hypothetical protein TWF788_003723 [Orbilia oligospora]|uniref:Uncharacterized protein n=1 Tax=Orbilia oligospora TaxID=2813651 RepID=A0A6G1LZD6_ORBOL|nr:hypothetical protein TWF788_003723 [Orbilia oligospora]KAF3198672.1 hypothetical protein TWF191_004776 [Orbilia oligospora]KAF3239711.1 hypothetical protein TWF192_009944 [Orbilia oligospora]